MSINQDAVQLYHDYEFYRDTYAEDAKNELIIGDYPQGKSDAYKCALHAMNDSCRDTKAMIQSLTNIRKYVAEKSEEQGVFLSYRFRLDGSIHFKPLTGEAIPKPQDKAYFYPRLRAKGMLEAFDLIIAELTCHSEREAESLA